MWMHIDDANYTKASVGVAVSNSPTGPFTYLYSFRPHGFESRDMTVFKDDDGAAYLFYSSRDNTELHISPLTEDYLHITASMKRILIRRHREAPAVFKHQGTYYMITSGCSGWAPNRALAHAADSIMGPWETLGNPCVGGNRFYRLTTFLSQSTFVLPLPGLPGTFIFMADRWSPSNLRDSRYVWLPLFIGGLADEPLDYSFGFPLWSRVSIYWHKKWRLPEAWSVGYTSLLQWIHRIAILRQIDCSETCLRFLISYSSSFCTLRPTKHTLKIHFVCVCVDVGTNFWKEKKTMNSR